MSSVASEGGPAHGLRGTSVRLAVEQLPEHVGQNPAVLIVTDLLRGVDPDGHRETDGGAVAALGRHGQLAAGGEPAGDRLGQPLDRVDLLAGQTRGSRRSRRRRNWSGRIPMPTRFERWIRS